MSQTPYNKWPKQVHARWIEVGNAFGRHLMAAARDYAFERIPRTLSGKARQAAETAALNAIYGMMMLLDGAVDSKIDKSHRLEYVLLARVLKANHHQPLEQFELAPDGDGLCMGFHGWVAGDFGNK